MNCPHYTHIQWNLIIRRTLGPWKLLSYTVEPHYNENLGTIKITLLYQVSCYIRVKKQRNIKNWDQQNYLVIRGFCYIRPLYNEVPLYQVFCHIRVQNTQRNIKCWDQQNYLVIRGFCFIRAINIINITRFRCIHVDPAPSAMGWFITSLDGRLVIITMIEWGGDRLVWRVIAGLGATFLVKSFTTRLASSLWI